MRRWLLWNLRCLRGRRCADVVPVDIPPLPPGAHVTIAYVCGNCGTEYIWDGGRRRARPGEVDPEEEGTYLGPGESAAVRATVRPGRRRPLRHR